MEYSQLSYEVSDRISTITLNRPERMNALTSTMCLELVDVFGKTNADDDVRVVIITGAGRAFCAGADLDPEDSALQPLAQGSEVGIVRRDSAGQVTLAMYDLKKPVIVAFNGVAVGGGITITLSADIRLASENARFSFLFSRRGFSSEGASNWFLPRVVGMGKATEWMLTGRMIEAKEAFACGLVNEILPSEALMPRAREIAADIVNNTAPVAVALCRQLLWRTVGADHPMEAHKIESRVFPWTLAQPDAAEGVKSFFDKRPPRFTMKPSKDMPSFYPWWTDRPFE